MENYQIKTNFKYLSKNPISRFLVNNFNKTIQKAISQIQFSSILDVGCGEGVTFNMIEPYLKNKTCMGIDLDPAHIEMSKQNAPFCDYQTGDIYNISFDENSFDVLLCLEVMEHLEYPEKAIEQLYKTTSQYLIISVPREPVWRMLNMLRGSYWKHLGNTPGHLNHWSTKSIKKFTSKNFNIKKTYTPLPWTILVCEKKPNPDEKVV